MPFALQTHLGRKLQKKNQEYKVKGGKDRMAPEAWALKNSRWELVFGACTGQGCLLQGTLRTIQVQLPKGMETARAGLQESLSKMELGERSFSAERRGLMWGAIKLPLVFTGLHSWWWGKLKAEALSKENSSRSSRAGPWGSWTDSWLIPCPWCRSPLASASGTIPSQSMAMTGPLLAAGLCLFMSIFEDSLGCSTKGLLPLIRELQGVGLTPKI